MATEQQKEKYSQRDKTKHFDLILPGLDDPADVTDLNDNFVMIDEALNTTLNTQLNQETFTIREQASAYPGAPLDERTLTDYASVDFINPDPNVYTKVLLTFWSISCGVCTPLTIVCSDLGRQDATVIGFVGAPGQTYRKPAAGKETKYEAICDYPGAVVRFPYKSTDAPASNSLTIVIYRPVSPELYKTPKIYAKAIWLR